MRTFQFVAFFSPNGQLGGITMLGSRSRFARDMSFTGRTLACVAASIGIVASASAADMDGLVLKAPPVVPDLSSEPSMSPRNMNVLARRITVLSTRRMA